MGVNFAITGGRPTTPVRVSAVSAVPRVVKVAGRLKSPSVSALAAARAKVAETVRVAPASSEPNDGTKVKYPEVSFNSHLTGPSSLLVSVNEAVTPRAKSRVVADIDTGRIVRAVVVDVDVDVVVVVVVVVVVGRKIVGFGVGLTAAVVAGVDAAVAIVVVVSLRGGETDAIVVVDSTVAIVVETVVESITIGSAGVALVESLFC